MILRTKQKSMGHEVVEYGAEIIRIASWCAGHGCPFWPAAPTSTSVGLGASVSLAEVANGATTGEHMPNSNARFWTWWNGRWVKLTLRPGQRMVAVSVPGWPLTAVQHGSTTGGRCYFLYVRGTKLGLSPERRELENQFPDENVPKIRIGHNEWEGPLWSARS